MDSVGARWEMAEMRPGKHPFSSLAEALLSGGSFLTRASMDDDVGDLEAQVGFLRASLRDGPMALCDVLRQNGLPPRTNFFLLVDQFEEMFAARQEGNIDTADEFVALLLASAEQKEIPIYIVITMRVDFLGDCTVFRGLAEAINSSIFLTPRLTREQRKVAITRPARLRGADIDPALTNHLLNEAGASPDQLPLLQHLLMRMWSFAEGERSRAGGGERIRLNFAHYEQAGGFEKALSLHAGEAFSELDPRQQEIASVVFRAICELGLDGRERRRLVSLEHLAGLAQTEMKEVRTVAEVFRRDGRNFLMPPPNKALLPITNLDISHEALIRNWELLRAWVRDEAESAEMYLDLEKNAQKHQRRRVGLLTSPGLEWTQGWWDRAKPTVMWAQRYGGDFELAVEYLKKSQQAKDDEEARKKESEERYTRELERRLVFEKQATENERALRETERKAREQVEQRSKMYFHRAEKRIQEIRDPKRFVMALHYCALALRLNPANSPAAKLACELLTQRNWMPPVTPRLRLPTAIRAAAFTPTGDSVVAVAEDGKLWRWSGAHFSQINEAVLLEEIEPPLGGRLLNSASFEEGGRKLIVGIANPTSSATIGRFFEWSDEQSRYVVQDLEIEFKEPFRAIVFLGDGKHLLALPSNFSAWGYQVFRKIGNVYKEVTSELSLEEVTAAAVDDSKDMLVTSTSAGGLRFWDTKTLQAVSPGELKLPVKGPPYLVRFGPGPDQVSALVYKEPIRVIDLRGNEVSRITASGADDLVAWFSFSKEVGAAKRIALMLNGRTSIVHSGLPRNVIAEPLCYSGSAGFPSFSSDGRHILVHSGQIWHTIDTLRVWDSAVIPSLEVDGEPFKGEDAPSWLPELAELLTGLTTDEDDDQPVLACLSQLKDTVKPDEVRGEYIRIWHRFFPEADSK